MKGSEQMSEMELKILESFREIIPKLPEKKQEYVLGLAEGMAAMMGGEKHEAPADNRQI